MKKSLFFVFLLVSILTFSLCVFAEEFNVEADGVEDITGAIEGAIEGDTVNVTLVADLEFNSSISITKAITVNVDFNGYQINYTGNSGKNTTTAAFYLNNAGALLNLNGKNPLVNPKEYTHYGDGVKADMVGTGNLIGISTGSVNIKDAYLYATNDTFVIYVGMSSGADVGVCVDTSVLRTNSSASQGAICYLGGNNNGNNDIVKKTLTLENSVEYGGFKGVDCAFNVTRGSSVTNVKFYDFAITNDCWAGIQSLYMVSFEDAMPFYHCVFNTYDEQVGNISVKTETGKQNIKLYDCQYAEIVNGGKFSGDSGGTAHIYIIEKMPSCVENGSAYSYSNPKGAQNTGDMSNYKKDSFTLNKSGHSEGDEGVIYENGYGAKGYGYILCPVCLDKYENGKEYAPVFENLGYSVNQVANSFTMGLKLNKDALDKYLEIAKPSAFDFGALVGNDRYSVEWKNGKLSVQNGYSVSFKRSACEYFDLKMIGFNDENETKEFIAEYYVYDGEKISYLDEKPQEAEKMTFAGVVDVLDEVNQKARALLESKHKLYYNDDGSFRVLVLADMHMSPSSNATAVQERIKTMVDRENPNLVVFTGDNVVGAGSESSLRACIDKLVGYIEEKQIPWCHVYGNHDREAGMSNEAQQKVYESYEYCISKDEADISGTGNYVHGIYNKNDTLGSVIYFLDSGTSDKTYSYEYIKEDQIAWYKSASETLEAYTGAPVKGIMAFHIPLLENTYADKEKNNTDVVYEYSGDKGEAICPSYYDTDLFETILERGDVEAIVTGHDHSNSYMYNYYGIKLCSAPTISKLGYSGGDAYDGCRVFDIRRNEIKTYVSYVIERVNPDDYEKYDSNIVLADFEDNAYVFSCEGLDGANLSGSLRAEIENGQVKIVRSSSGNSEVNITLDSDKIGKLGNNKYLVVRVDFTGVDFRKACFGLISGSTATVYRTDDYDRNSPLYYLAEGESEWKEMSHGSDGCFGTAQNSSMIDKCGYIAVPVEYFRAGGAKMNENTLVTGIYMYLDVNAGAGQPFYLDNFMLVEDYTTVGK